jgi:hypothetical protein
MTYTLVYHRFGVEYEVQCDSAKEAVHVAAAAEDAGSMSATAVLGPGGVVLLDRFDLCEAMSAIWNHEEG